MTPHRRLNKLLGRIAFLPCLTPCSLWDMGHNVVHHGYTNLKGVDFVWAPLTAEEFAALSPGQRLLQRTYRSGGFPGLYCMVEIWWKREFFPSRRHMPTRRVIFIQDSSLAAVFGLLWAAAVAGGAVLAGRSVGVSLLCGVLVPFPFKVGALVHQIMEHTAHHVDISLPLYRLKQAQATLEEMLPGRIIVQRFSWRWYFETARACKLYDFTRECWTDCAGRITSPVRGNLPPAGQAA